MMMVLNVHLFKVNSQQQLMVKKLLIMIKCHCILFVIKFLSKPVKNFAYNVKKDTYKLISVYLIMLMVVNTIKFLKVKKTPYVYKQKEEWKLIIMYQNVKLFLIIKQLNQIVKKSLNRKLLQIVDFIKLIKHVCNVVMDIY